MGEEVQQPVQPPLTSEASKERIASAGSQWFQVLGLTRRATLEEVKNIHRKLVLLHHPDKAGGDADTFKLIQKAYEEGKRICMVRSLKQTKVFNKTKAGKAKAKAKPKARPKAKLKARKVMKAKAKGKPKAKREPKPEDAANLDPSATEEHKSSAETPTVQAERKSAAEIVKETMAQIHEESNKRGVKRARPKPVPANASKAKLASAIEKWDSGSVKGKTMPDEVQKVSAEDAAVWLREGSCVPVDVRPQHECAGPTLPGVSFMTYFQFLTAPEEARPEVTRLLEERKRLLIFSQDGSSMGPCGLVASLLLDVFGFEDDHIFRLEGGYAKLIPLLDIQVSDNHTVESALNARNTLAAASKAQKQAESALAKARAELAVYDAASREHVEVLSKGTWQSVANAQEHLAQLSPLLKPLKLESSLLAMLQNAGIKRPAQRGPFDSMVFTELTIRFSQKLEALRSEVAAAASSVSEQTAAVRSAQAEVDEISKAPRPGNAVTEAPASDSVMTEAPVSDSVMTEAPVSDSAVTEAPVSDSAMTEAPATEAEPSP